MRTDKQAKQFFEESRQAFIENMSKAEEKRDDMAYNLNFALLSFLEGVEQQLHWILNEVRSNRK